MTYFIGVRLPKAVSEEILFFRKQWKGNGIIPHITVKAPCGLNSDEAWILTVQRICRARPAIKINVSGIDAFGTSVLFLRVVSPELVALHNLLVMGLGITDADQSACFEGAQYSPHVTLLQTRQEGGLTIPKLAVAAAIERFTEPVNFQASKLVIYRKEARKEYQEYLEINLGS